MSPRERQIQVGDSPLHLVDSGKRSVRTLITVHGFPGADHMALRNTPGFENLELEARVIYYDRRGTGHSPATSDAAADPVDAHVADLAALVEAVGADRPILIGHDAGAAIGLAFAIDHPAALSGLVLVNPRIDLGPANRTAFEEQAAQMLEDPTAGGLVGGAALADETAFRTAMNLVFPLGFLHFGLVERTFMKKLTFHRDAYAAGWRADDHAPLRDGLSDLRVPALVLSGRYDPFADLSEARAIADAMPNARFHLFHSSAHWPFLEEPQDFSQVVWDWAEEVAAHIV